MVLNRDLESLGAFWNKKAVLWIGMVLIWCRSGSEFLISCGSGSRLGSKRCWSTFREKSIIYMCWELIPIRICWIWIGMPLMPIPIRIRQDDADPIWSGSTTLQKKSIIRVKGTNLGPSMDLFFVATLLKDFKQNGTCTVPDKKILFLKLQHARLLYCQMFHSPSCANQFCWKEWNYIATCTVQPEVQRFK